MLLYDPEADDAYLSDPEYYKNRYPGLLSFHNRIGYATFEGGVNELTHIDKEAAWNKILHNEIESPVF